MTPTWDEITTTWDLAAGTFDAPAVRPEDYTPAPGRVIVVPAEAWTGYEWTKDPDSTLDYCLDWTKWLAEGDSLVAGEWVAQGGLTAARMMSSPTKTALFIAGGTVSSEPRRVTCRVRTLQGRTEDRSFFMRVQER